MDSEILAFLGEHSYMEEHLDHKPSLPCFPQELTDLVIDCLHGDLTALRACALTCRTWLPRSRTHLHRVMKLVSYDLLCRAISTYTGPGPTVLTHYVREMRISDSLFRTADRKADWVNKQVPALMSSLTTLENVLMQDVRYVEWGVRPLFHTVTKLAVNRIEFKTPIDLTRFLGHFPSLTTLLIENLTVVERRADPTKRGPRPPLDTLRIASGNAQEFLLNWFLYQPPEMLRLKNLAYTVERWRVAAPLVSLQALGRSVKDLTIIYAYESPHYLLKNDPLLSHLTSIQTLTFDLATGYGTFYGAPSIPYLLRSVVAGSVASLRFRFSLDNRHPALDECLEQVGRIRLPELGRQIDILETLADLAEVTVEIRSNEWFRFVQVGSRDQWVALEMEQRRLTNRATHRPRPKSTEGGAESDAEGQKSDSEWGRVARQRVEADYDKTKDTWRKAQATVERALPSLLHQNLLKVSPIEYESPASSPTQTRRANVVFPREFDIASHLLM